MANYLITGGIGYIGRHLAKKLIEQHHDVTILDNCPYDTEYEIPKYCKYINGDVLDEKLLTKALQKKDGCFHLASLSSPRVADKNPLLSHKFNVVSNLTVLKALGKSSETNRMRFVYLSSSAVYGDNACMPVKENDYLRPITAFAADKLCCENHARSAFIKYRVPSVGFRLFNLYGPEDLPNKYEDNVVSEFIRQIKTTGSISIFGSGEQLRDFIYIDDAVEYMIRGMNKNDNSAEIFNLCTGKGISINHLAKTLITISGLPISINYFPHRAGDVIQSVGDPNKANNSLEYCAVTNVGDGLKYAYEKFNTCLDFITPKVISTRSLVGNF